MPRRTTIAIATAKVLLQRGEGAPVHGYELGESIGHSTSTTYQVLQRFADAGWITSDISGPIAPGRQRRLWRLAPGGAEQLREWLASAPPRNRAARRAARTPRRTTAE